MAQLLSGLQLASITPQRIEDDFRQDDFTNFCENIYFFARSLQPNRTWLCLGGVFELRLGFWEWGYYLSGKAGGDHVD